MERGQFTFYASFATAIARIKSKAARCDAYDAIVNYAISGTEPDVDSLPDAAAIAFDLIRPVLDKGAKRAASGAAGGSKQTESKPEANRKQTAREKEGEVEVEEEGEREKEVENECSIPPVAPFSDRPVLRDALDRWLAYKRERRETYKATGMTTLVNQITRNAATYGDDAVAEVIDNSIASHYQGIVFDRLKRDGRQTAQKVSMNYGDRSADIERMRKMLEVDS